MSFISSIAPLPNNLKASFWFIFKKHRLLINVDKGPVSIPLYDDILKSALEPENPLYLGALNGYPCYSADLGADAALPPNMQFRGLRELFGLLTDDLWTTAGYALHITEWDRGYLYCNRCGQALEYKEDERAKICSKCRLINYPRINPCIIVALTMGDQILLARSGRFPKGTLYSVLAGYVEPGETLEACVRREIKEEVNLEVKNIHYFSSQPWPFSSSLMIAFTAEYAKGDIKIDGKEIVEAGWYAAHRLPDVPGQGSISGRLIDWFVRKNSG